MKEKNECGLLSAEDLKAVVFTVFHLNNCFLFFLHAIKSTKLINCC